MTSLCGVRFLCVIHDAEGVALKLRADPTRFDMTLPVISMLTIAVQLLDTADPAVALLDDDRHRRASPLATGRRLAAFAEDHVKMDSELPVLMRQEAQEMMLLPTALDLRVRR